MIKTNITLPEDKAMYLKTSDIQRFTENLRYEEKSEATRDKYLRDIRSFQHYIANRDITKVEVMSYKEYLKSRYAPASVNSMLVALNGFLRFLGLEGCCVKLLKVQQQIFCREDKELTRREYQRLIRAAGNTRISYIIQTICGTGIRVSELQYITAEAVRLGRTIVDCKNKTRVIFIPTSVQSLLKKYMKKHGISNGSVFVSKNGKPIDRSSIWRQMKALCHQADVVMNKVFPHNLRHLFARTFYSLEKDVVRLADLLGHSSVNTTRIYIMDTGRQHISQLDRVQAILRT